MGDIFLFERGIGISTGGDGSGGRSCSRQRKRGNKRWHRKNTKASCDNMERVLVERRADGQEHRIRTLNDKLESECLIRRARGTH